MDNLFGALESNKKIRQNSAFTGKNPAPYNKGNEKNVQLASFLHLVKGYIFERRYRYATTIFAIAVAIAVLCIVTALGLGIVKVVIPEMEKMFPERILVAKPRTTDVSLMRLDVTAITDQTIQHIENVPGVERISPQLGLAFPVSAEGSIFGETIRTDVVVYGVKEWLVAQDVAPGETFRYSANPDDPVPVLISQFFLDIYNLGLAQSSGLPKFNPHALVGKRFRLFLGEYTLMAGGIPGKKREVTCKIIGLSHDLSLLGMTMPLRYVEEFNAWYLGNPVAHYTALHIFLRSLDDFDSVNKELNNLGLRVESNREMLNRYRSALRLAMLVLLTLGLSVLTIAMSNLANMVGLLMIERRGDIGLLKALGATRREILGVFLAEVCAITFVGGGLGGSGAIVLMLIGKARLENLLSQFAIVPSGIFYIHWGIVLVGLAFAVILGGLVALPIIRRASMRPASELLSEG
jgi:ABC-type lipoprotein release transport system permease subunit